MENIDRKTVDGFGDEWSRFDQTGLSEEELLELFDQYFKIFPWSIVHKNSIGFDLGCGSGRWAKLVADRVGKLNCIDASVDALSVAKRNLKNINNCIFHLASVDAIPLKDNSMDFGYSLGVLHHVPNTAEGIKACVKKLRSGAPFLIYLYYAFDNRNPIFIMLFKCSNVLRYFISRMPYFFRYCLSQIIAVFIYLPLARIAFMLERMGINVDSFPLSSYSHRSFYTMRTDALDRFGTLLEQRFTAKEIKQMMEDSGLEKIEFNNSIPYWCAVGYKR